MTISNQHILCLMGPTASGKTRLALELAHALNGEIVNADSMQLYNCFPILSAHPTTEEMATVPHHLFGVLHPPAQGSAAAWAQMAQTKISDIHARGKLPILVGGTGLYFEFLLFGASAIPEIDNKFREQAKAEFAANPEQVREKLAVHDPEIAARLKPNDTQRLVRAYEVWLATGKPLSAWQKQEFVKPQHDWTPSCLLLLPERDVLYKNIDNRFRQMMENGALLEAQKATDLAPDHPALKTLGVQELYAYRQGKLSLEQAVEKATTKSRNYAKRQYTWFNNRFLNKAKENDVKILTLGSATFAENLLKAKEFAR